MIWLTVTFWWEEEAAVIRMLKDDGIYHLFKPIHLECYDLALVSWKTSQKYREKEREITNEIYEGSMILLQLLEDMEMIQLSCFSLCRTIVHFEEVIDWLLKVYLLDGFVLSTERFFLEEDSLRKWGIVFFVGFLFLQNRDETRSNFVIKLTNASHDMACGRVT